MRVADALRRWLVAAIVVGSASGAASAGQRGTAGPAGTRPPMPPVTPPTASTPPAKPSTTHFSTGLVFRPAAHGRRTVRPGRTVRPLAASPLWWWGPEQIEPLDQPEPPDEERRVVVAPPVPPGPSSIQPAETPTRPSAPASEAGTVRLEVTPSTAIVYVDGFYAGPVDAANRSGGLSLNAGWHRLVFRSPGHETAAVNVTVKSQSLATVRLALLSP